MRPHRLVNYRLLAPVLALALLAACSRGGSADQQATPSTTVSLPPSTTTPADPLAEPLIWRTCEDAEGAECATLTVPVDHDDPSGRTLDLVLGRKTARNPARRLGTLVVHPGGPGVSGIDELSRLTFDEEVLDRFDIMSWDSRGVGRSAALRCGPTVHDYWAHDLAPDNPVEQLSLEQGAQKVAEECAAKTPELVAHMSSQDVARDLEAIRNGLAVTKLSYVGFSYGTLVGQFWANRHPGSVRAMVLDGVVDPSHDVVAQTKGTLAGLAQSIEALTAACSKDCPVKGGVAAGLKAVLERVESQPLPGADGRPTVGPTRVMLAVLTATYDPGLWRSLWDGLAQAQAGNGATLGQMADAYLELFSPAANLATTCLDLPAPRDQKAYAAYVTSLGEPSTILPGLGAMVGNLGLPCASWQAAPKRPTGALRAEGSPEVLVVGNTGDNVTPYASATKVATALAKARLLRFEGQGHLSLGRSSCVDEAVTTYLVALEVPEEGAVC